MWGFDDNLLRVSTDVVFSRQFINVNCNYWFSLSSFSTAWTLPFIAFDDNLSSTTEF